MNDAFESADAETLAPDDRTLSSPGRSTGSPAPGLDRGATLGRFVVTGRLGAGGMGVVYSAYDPDLERRVAIKLMHPELGGSEAERRTLREAQAMAKVDDDHVITVHDVGTWEGRVFIAMELIDGQTLRGWLAARPRGWREILTTLSAAGRGLHAIHEAGLVHRDFKPDNVMVARDGRVRVMDLGLVRRDGTPTASTDALHTTAQTDLDPSVTEGLVGTPAYMPAEQLRQGDVGPAADQFAFCVTLWEALYGERPFAGGTLAEVAAAVVDGAVRPPPEGRQAPRWLPRVVRRGLGPAPEDRWPSVAHLLDAIRRGQGRARTRVAMLGLTGLGVVVALGVGLGRLDQARRRAACDDTARVVEAQWHGGDRARVHAALGDAGTDYARATADRTVGHVDAWAEAWTDASREVCRQEVAGTRPATDVADATRCLDARRRELEALRDVLTTIDARVLRSATSAASRLTAPERCVGPALQRPRLTGRSPAGGPDPLTLRLVEAGALRSAGQFAEAAAMTRAVVEDAGVADRPLLVARARTLLGQLQEQLGEYEPAAASLEAAFFDAGTQGDDATAIDAATSLLFVLGDRLARAEEGERWGRHAQMLLERQDPDALVVQRATLTHYRASVRLAAGDFAAARDLAAAASDAFAEHLGPEHPDRMAAVANQATAHFSRGEHDLAIARYEQARDGWSSTLGPSHPQLATVIDNIGNVHLARGHWSAALRAYEEALQLRESALGAEHVDVSISLDHLASAWDGKGEPERAVALYRRALGIVETNLGPEHPDVAFSLVNLGNTLQSLGELDEAQASIARAHQILAEALPPTHPNLAIVLDNLGAIALLRHDAAGAQEAYARELEIFEATLPPGHLHLASALTGLGRARLAADRPHEAVAPLERGLSIRMAQDSPATDRAQTRFALARALWPAGPAPDEATRLRAQRLASEAAEEFASQGERFAHDVANVEQWLAARTDAAPQDTTTPR